MNCDCVKRIETKLASAPFIVAQAAAPALRQASAGTTWLLTAEEPRPHR